MAYNISSELDFWVPDVNEHFKCKGCAVCNGNACKGQLPGMGGIDNSKNFIANVSAWKNFYDNSSAQVQEKIDSIKIVPGHIGIGPVTGANQNIGFASEQDFYLPYFAAALSAGVEICVGDGAPDEKLKFGNEAVRKLGTKAYYFFKPYPDENLRGRIDLVRDSALTVGMDIDAFNIITMRNQAHLERKTPDQVRALQAYAGLPMILKGIFSKEDVELCRQTKPFACIVSNHGGRVETAPGSTLDFLKENAAELHQVCQQVWVDGGIRTKTDIKTAIYLGADKVLIARSFISHLIKGGVSSMKEYAQSLFD